MQEAWDERANRIARNCEAAKDLSPTVRHFAALAIGSCVDRLADDDLLLTHQSLLDIRGEIRGALAFSRQIDRAIKSGPTPEEDQG